jgi:hypothetical protein
MDDSATEAIRSSVLLAQHLAEAVVRPDAIQTFRTTSLFLFLVTDSLLPYARREDQSEALLALVEHYIAIVWHSDLDSAAGSPASTTG